MTMQLDGAVAGLILTSLLHLISAVWWASRLTTRLEGLERWQARHDTVLEVLSCQSQALRSLEQRLDQEQRGTGAP